MTKQSQLILTGVLALFLCFNQACAQQKGNQRRQQAAAAPIDSAKWRVDNYIVNRDSAFANPYYALQKLVGGNKRFQEARSIHPRQDPAVIERLSQGQSPFAIIIGCSDSRVSSEILFDQGFGDLFVGRTAGQVMAAATYATIEYAYLMLQTKLVVVLGHSSCGAVTAAIKRPEHPEGHIVTLINAIKPAAIEIQDMEGDTTENAVRQNVINQVKSLRQLESVLSRAYNNGDMLIVGGVYTLADGKVEILKETLKDLPRTKYSTADITGKY